MSTDLGASETLGSKGMYGWSGIYGTNFWVDPKEKLIAIMMVIRERAESEIAPEIMAFEFELVFDSFEFALFEL